MTKMVEEHTKGSRPKLGKKKTETVEKKHMCNFLVGEVSEERGGAAPRR
jgi:hypothetical protein